MRIVTAVNSVGALFLITSLVAGQPPGRPGDESKRDRNESTAASFVTRMMTFDSDHDGTLRREEVTDVRLLHLFADADVDKNGVVTTDELTAYFNKESPNLRRGGPDRPGPRGPGGRGGPGFGGPSPIGEVMPPPVRDLLRLTNAQRKKMDALQKMIDAKLEQILTEEQKTQLDQIRRHPGPPDEDQTRPRPLQNGNRDQENREPDRPSRPAEKASE